MLLLHSTDLHEEYYQRLRNTPGLTVAHAEYLNNVAWRDGVATAICELERYEAFTLQRDALNCDINSESTYEADFDATGKLLFSVIVLMSLMIIVVVAIIGFIRGGH